MLTHLKTRSLASSSDICEGTYPRLALHVPSFTPNRFPIVSFLSYGAITPCLSSFSIHARFISDLRLVVLPRVASRWSRPTSILSSCMTPVLFTPFPLESTVASYEPPTPLPCSLLIRVGSVTVSLNLASGPSLPSIYRSLAAPKLLTLFLLTRLHGRQRYCRETSSLVLPAFFQSSPRHNTAMNTVCKQLEEL